MDLTKYRHTDSVTIDSPPEAVYALVADVTRMGEFSPVCKSAQWIDDDHTRFTGDNVLPDMQWTTTCRVDVAEPGQEFTFTNLGMDGARELVRWSYTMAPAAGGTTLDEHWEVLPGYGDFWASVAPNSSLEDYLDSVVDRTHSGMAETLANIKTAAEG
jgi:ribosome-associated toxin RatA of RatAB toxin-antitoxin module